MTGPVSVEWSPSAHTAQMDAYRWIDALPPELAVQARLLRALIAAVEADPRWEALELGCSLAAGRADADSDLDVGLWHVDGARPGDAEVEAMVRGLGDVVEVSAQPWDGVPRWWGQYADGGQLDLVVLAAADRTGRAPGAVVLLDRSGRLADEFTPTVLSARPGEPRQWLLDGWEALAHAAKYLRRGSLLEAVEQLHRARQRIFQLWAAGEGVDYPVFGLTSLLDAEAATLPPGIESTYPVIAPASVAVTADTLARALSAAGHHVDPALDTPLADYVTAKLARAAAVVHGSDRDDGRGGGGRETAGRSGA